ncbi:MAG: hypothetical protein EAZ36_00870 [Verrucomicrobia bacterium]|nr:MAG: hypothetical protein EAZ36_00870 [Verrucomicrobiota bacterium]
MKKTLWFAFGCLLLFGLVQVLRNSWQTAEYFRESGRPASIKVGTKCNASHWSSPLPLKRVHTYVALLAPDHEVVISTAKDLKENETYFVRFLLRDKAAIGRELSFRPIVESMRLKAEADGTPVRLEDTSLFDRALEKAMGPLGPGAYVPPARVAEAAPSQKSPSVPFMISGENDGPFTMLAQNITLGEGLALFAWLVAIKMIFLHAWATTWDSTPAGTIKRKNWVHPTLRQTEPDPTPAPPRPVSSKSALRLAPRPNPPAPSPPRGDGAT